MIPKRHFRRLCGGIFAYLVQPNLQNIQKHEFSILTQCHTTAWSTVPLYCAHTLLYCSAGSRWSLRGRLGELCEASEHPKRALESRSVGDRSQFPTSKRLGLIAERHGATPMLWESLEPRKSRIRPGIPVWAGCRQRFRQQ